MHSIGMELYRKDTKDITQILVQRATECILVQMEIGGLPSQLERTLQLCT